MQISAKLVLKKVTDVDVLEELHFIDNDPEEALERYEEDLHNRSSHYNRLRRVHSPWCGFVYCNASEQNELVTLPEHIGIATGERPGCNHLVTHPYKKPFNRRPVSNLTDARPHYRVDEEPFFPPPVPWVHTRSEWRKSIRNIGQYVCARSQTCEVCTKGNLTIGEVVRLLQDIKEPSNGSDHLVYTRTLVFAIAHFEWNEAWRPFIMERALDILCSVYPEANDRSHGWLVQRQEWGFGHQLTWSESREIRDVSEVPEQMCGKGYWRIIKRSSEFATLLVHQLHDQAHFSPVDAVLHRLEVIGIKIPQVGTMVRQVLADCKVCHTAKATLGQVSQLLKRVKSGPIDLATVSKLNEEIPSSYWICDTAGPLKVKCDTTEGCFSEVHVVIFVQIYFRRVVMFLVPNLSVQAMVEAMTALVSTEGRIELLITDPGSQLSSLANEFGPIVNNEDEDSLKILTDIKRRSGGNVWLDLLIHRYSGDMKSDGVRFKISVKGQSHLQGLAEKVVEKVKLFFSDERVFKVQDEGTLTEYECRKRLYLIMHNINSIPFHTLSPGVRFSPNDLLGVSGRIAVNVNYPDMFKDNLVNPTATVKDAIRSMERLNMRIRLDVFRFFLPLLRDDSVRLGKDRGKKGSGDPTTIDMLTKGSIVVDLDKVRRTHSLRGSIARVELLTTGNRGAIISSVRQESLKNLSSDVRKQIRSCDVHKERGCQVCMSKMILDRSKGIEVDIRARPSDKLFLIHRELPVDEPPEERRMVLRRRIREAGRVDEPLIEGQYTPPIPQRMLDEFLEDEKWCEKEDLKRENRDKKRNRSKKEAKESRRIIQQMKKLKPANRIKALANVIDDQGREEVVTRITPEDKQKVDLVLRKSNRIRGIPANVHVGLYRTLHESGANILALSNKGI